MPQTTQHAMQVDLTFRHTHEDSHEATKAHIEQQLEKHLKPKLEGFHLAQMRIHVTVELHKSHYNVTLRLPLPPKKVMVTHASDTHLPPAIDAAINKLTRQVEKHHAHISGRADWSRKTRQRHMKHLELEANQVSKKQPSAEESLLKLLPRLASYIRHEMTYLRANGDIQSRYPSVTDILDEVYLKAQRSWSTLPKTDEALYQATLKIATELLKREVSYKHDHESDISMEDLIPEDAQQQAEDMVEEEIQEFYQPDEVMHIEDLIPGKRSAVPEQQLELQAIDSCYRLLAHMPYRWRQVVTLVYREQIEIVIVAETILNIPVDEIRHTLAQAEAFIHTHLEEQGLANWSDLATLLKPR